MLRLTDVVKQLLIINAILFVVSILPLYQYMPDLAMYYPASPQFRPYQIITHMFMPGSVVGASGALFGILVAFGMYFPDTQLMLLIPPIPMKAKYMVILCIALEFFMLARGAETQIAHYAHLGGALFGFLIILYWRKTGK